jgi:hypothetical protein
LRQTGVIRTWQSAAASNNAEWCDLVARSHGATTQFKSDAWTSQDRTPQYYPDAVTLTPRLVIPDLLSRVDTSIGCTIKDSFAALDLAPYGFRVLFDAEWIVRSPRLSAVAPSGPQWKRITRSDALAEWEDAWRPDDGSKRLLRAELLDHNSVAVVAAEQADQIVAGAILNSSSTVVGISNVLSRPDVDLDPWPGCLAFAGSLFPGKPLVGYEFGAGLLDAKRNGFQDAGPLRVWITDDDSVA